MIVERQPVLDAYETRPARDAFFPMLLNHRGTRTRVRYQPVGHLMRGMGAVKHAHKRKRVMASADDQHRKEHAQNDLRR